MIGLIANIRKIDKRVLVFFVALFVGFPTYMLSSFIVVGEPRMIEAQITGMGAGHSATGSSIIYSSVTDAGEYINFNSSFGETLRIGDKVKIKAKNRLFLFSDKYVYGGKLQDN